MVRARIMRRGPSKAWQRLVFATFSGLVAVAVSAWLAPWQFTVLLGWDVAAVAVLVRVWLEIGGMDAHATRAWATREDYSRAASEVILVAASVVSLVGVAFAFAKANEGDQVLEPLLTSTGVLTIALSWFVVHTMYVLRYAHLYYTEPIGGIDFKSGRRWPDYRDFAYVAFTVGMTYQVSDTDVTDHRMRVTVLRHALLSFLFGAVILATVVNIVAGVIKT